MWGCLQGILPRALASSHAAMAAAGPAAWRCQQQLVHGCASAGGGQVGAGQQVTLQQLPGGCAVTPRLVQPHHHHQHGQRRPLHTSAAQHAGASTAGRSSSQQQQRRQQQQPGQRLRRGAPTAKQQRAYQARLHAYKARLPRSQKYGPALRERDAAAFEAMRLVVGYYDLPQNRHKQRPPPPSHATINLLQTLQHTRDVDPYYKLALLSYRTKLENERLVQVEAATRAFLARLAAPPDFVPSHLEELTTAALAAKQRQQQQREEAATGAGTAASAEGAAAAEGSSDAPAAEGQQPQQ